MDTPTSQQVHVLQHTLGLRIDRREPYRNHFVAGHGHHDMASLEALEAQGLMKRVRSPGFLGKGDIVFAATEAGRELAIASLPPIPKLTRYREFHQQASDASFGEFLCGRKLPKFEMDALSSRGCGKVKYRMYREAGDEYGAVRDVQGEWRETKKEAKASYKEALASHRAALKPLEAVPGDDGLLAEDAGEPAYDRSQRGG